MLRAGVVQLLEDGGRELCVDLKAEVDVLLTEVRRFSGNAFTNLAR